MPKYKTSLSPDEESRFQEWYSRYAKQHNLLDDPDNPLHYYDYRGYWKANKYKFDSFLDHLPDTWKTPGHPTFSNESKYASYRNPGYWVGNDYNEPEDDEDLINFTKSFETFKAKPYVVNGQTLIGYGSANPKLIAKGQITEDEAAEEVRKKYRYLKNIAEKNVPNWYRLSRDTKRALLETMYNGGEGSILNKSPKLMELLASGVTDGTALSAQMDHSKTAGGWLGVRSSARRAMAQGQYNWDWEEVDKYGRQVDHEQYRGPEDWKASPYYNKYQQGGNLTYQPFIPSIAGTSPQTEDNIDVMDMIDNVETPFPVEPVNIGNFDVPNFTYKASKPEKQRGTTQFKHEGIDAGNMRELLDKFEEAGISVRVTSGSENRTTKQGRVSKHATADAIDITPIAGQTYEDLRRQIMDSPELLAYMRDNNIGIIDETDPLIKARTGATGDHWHISRGGERLALYGFTKLFG